MVQSDRENQEKYDAIQAIPNQRKAEYHIVELLILSDYDKSLNMLNDEYITFNSYNMLLYAISDKISFYTSHLISQASYDVEVFGFSSTFGRTAPTKASISCSSCSFAYNPSTSLGGSVL